MTDYGGRREEFLANASTSTDDMTATVDDYDS